jgi:hypothetical protein
MTDKHNSQLSQSSHFPSSARTPDPVLTNRRHFRRRLGHHQLSLTDDGSFTKSQLHRNLLCCIDQLLIPQRSRSNEHMQVDDYSSATEELMPNKRTLLISKILTNEVFISVEQVRKTDKLTALADSEVRSKTNGLLSLTAKFEVMNTAQRSSMTSRRCHYHGNGASTETSSQLIKTAESHTANDGRVNR